MSPVVESRWLGRVTYDKGLKLQESLVNGHTSGDPKNQLLLLEHEPVYTMGRTRDDSSLREETTLPHPVHRTNRGGQATYHGPGQLVGYPVLDLSIFGRDLHEYLRFLEEVLILVMGLRARVWREKQASGSVNEKSPRWVSASENGSPCMDLQSTSAAISPPLTISPPAELPALP